MNRVLVAAAMLMAPTAAEAAVTITFSDVNAGRGVVTIDTGHIGSASVTDGTTRYSGDGTVPFLTASFIDTAGNQRLLQRGDLDGYIEYDAATTTVSVSYTLDDGSDQFPTSTLVLSATGAGLGTFDGIQLPDLATASELFFSVTSSDGSVVDSTSGRATATTTAITPVPEPASWALMIAGFAAMGAALRRRRFVTAIA
ncbi:hypothetical protein GGQ80_001886 [Sphingomonas jinjuensis]|uniref:Ice-binding protein C-terminal domain-containing protein n=1 Tax=Sphingomonas jinjuensis TaxID=535907 RepID=A0A840F7Q2_9SPHN|nr:PEPxxWA-CTERM sorting domain-containing protein [Sphingomonas jinjuensis]MBB4153980.1 hypothetical protein [Sphingomonas jinjuensis]